jgi:hypothetical protein
LIPNPLGSVTFQQVADSIICNLQVIAAPIFAVMVIYGGIQIMSGAGNPSQIESGKKTLIWAVVGFAVVVLGREIIIFVKEILGAPTGGAAKSC